MHTVFGGELWYHCVNNVCDTLPLFELTVSDTCILSFEGNSGIFVWMMSNCGNLPLYCV